MKNLLVFFVGVILIGPVRALDPKPWDPRLLTADELAFLEKGRQEVLLAQAAAPPPPAPQVTDVVPAPAPATPALLNPLWKADLGGGFAFQLPSMAQVEAVNVLALRDYYNGQWLIGYGHEVAYLTRNGDELAYADVWNAFNTDDGRGVFGASIGIHPAAAFYDTIGALFGAAQSFGQSLPPWAQKLNSFTSLEIGEGNRFFGGGGPAKRRVDAIGGEINIPFGELFNHTGGL